MGRAQQAAANEEAAVQDRIMHQIGSDEDTVGVYIGNLGVSPTDAGTIRGEIHRLLPGYGTGLHSDGVIIIGAPDGYPEGAHRYTIQEMKTAAVQACMLFVR